MGFWAASFADPVIDRRGARVVAPVIFAVMAGVYGALAAVSGHASALIAMCGVWGAVNHLGLNLVVGRLAALDPARRGAILGLNSGVTYIALFAGTPLFGWVFGQAGFAACALLSGFCILPVLAEALIRRRRALPA